MSPWLRVAIPLLVLAGLTLLALYVALVAGGGIHRGARGLPPRHGGYRPLPAGHPDARKPPATPPSPPRGRGGGSR